MILNRCVWMDLFVWMKEKVALYVIDPRLFSYNITGPYSVEGALFDGFVLLTVSYPSQWRQTKAKQNIKQE